jgi:hypothetical protein
MYSINILNLGGTYVYLPPVLVSWVAQSVECLATGWTTEQSRFDPWQRQRIFLYPLCPDRLWGPPCLLYKGYGRPSLGLKRGRGVTLTTYPHLVPTLRMSRCYTASPPSAFMACSGTVLALPPALIICSLSLHFVNSVGQFRLYVLALLRVNHDYFRGGQLLAIFWKVSVL